MGREADLVFLHERLVKALSSERQLVFVTGEPGIGKTTLTDVFVSGVRRHQEVVSSKHSVVSSPSSPTPNPQSPTPGGWVARGQCVEHYGSGEAYLTVLEALGRLCREPSGSEIIALLRQHAPSWLVQMPALLSTAELEELQRRTQGATRERMLRELAEALEVIATEQPLMLVLEDLHWSDVSTLDLLSMLARRQEPARLLIIGTYRPVEVLTREHPLKGIKQELQLHGQCEELALDFLTEQHVVEYLEVRFPVGATGRSPLQRLAHDIHHRTDGNPLFMVNLVDHLLSQGVLIQTDGQLLLKDENLATTVPENLRQLIEQQITRVSTDERKILKAASVAGAEFSAAAVAAGTEQTIEAIETQCDGLVRREQFLRAQGTSEWPDGTTTVRYGFVHALYQEVLYDQLSATRCSRLHRQIGEREEQGYGERAGEIAAELAVHFERGRDYQRAIQYLRQAGGNASRRSAYSEASSLLTKGFLLLQSLPNTPERDQQELRLQLALGAALQAIKGYAAPEVGRAYVRAQKLCQQEEETPQLFPILWGLYSFSLIRGELWVARGLGERMLRLAQRIQDPTLLLRAHSSLGMPLYLLGELTLARETMEQAIALYNPQSYYSSISPYGGADQIVTSLSQEARALWWLGYPERALRSSYLGLALAQELSAPFNVAYAFLGVVQCHQYHRDEDVVREQAEAMMALSREHGFPYWASIGAMLRGWALVEQGQAKEGITQICQGLATYQATGAEVARAHYLTLLAEAYGKAGQTKEGLSTVDEAWAIVNKSGEYLWEAELYRLKGELLLNVERERQNAERQTKDEQRETVPFHPSSFIVRRKPKRVFRRRSTLPATAKLSPSNSVPL